MSDENKGLVADILAGLQDPGTDTADEHKADLANAINQAKTEKDKAAQGKDGVQDERQQQIDEELAKERPHPTLPRHAKAKWWRNKYLKERATSRSFLKDEALKDQWKTKRYRTVGKFRKRQHKYGDKAKALPPEYEFKTYDQYAEAKFIGIKTYVEYIKYKEDTKKVD